MMESARMFSTEPSSLGGVWPVIDRALSCMESGRAA
jgi:hypothetical protein